MVGWDVTCGVATVGSGTGLFAGTVGCAMFRRCEYRFLPEDAAGCKRKDRREQTRQQIHSARTCLQTRACMHHFFLVFFVSLGRLDCLHQNQVAYGTHLRRAIIRGRSTIGHRCCCIKGGIDDATSVLHQTEPDRSAL